MAAGTAQSTTSLGSGINPSLLMGGSDATRKGKAASSARSSASGSEARLSPNGENREEDGEEDASMNEDDEEEDEDEEEEDEEEDEDELPSFDLDTFNAMCFPNGIDASLEANNLALPVHTTSDLDPRRAMPSNPQAVEASSSSVADDASLMLSFMPGGDGLARLISFLTQVLGSKQDIEAEDQQNLKVSSKRWLTMRSTQNAQHLTASSYRSCHRASAESSWSRCMARMQHQP